jgi:hypothetical protein
VELEQRVKTLEYEMKILKNEIQRTLLDIHEQILIHYYPSLRIEEAQPPASVAQAVEAARAKRAEQPPAPPAPSLEGTSLTPTVRKTSLDQIRQARNEPLTPKPTETPQGVFVKLLEWVVKNTTRFGSNRLNRLLKVCGEEGMLSSDTLVVLLQVVALNQGNEPPQVSVNDLLDEVLKLDKLLGRNPDAEEALLLIEEAGLG